MPSDAPTANKDAIDPATVAEIARQVVARLRAASDSAQATVPGTTQTTGPAKTQTTVSGTTAAKRSIADRIVTAAAIERLPTKLGQVLIASDAIVTPAAKDEAARRGITFSRAADAQTVSGLQAPSIRVHQNADEQPQICDSNDAARADAVRMQLTRRGTVLRGAKILLSDTPARDVYQQCARRGEAAVMIGSLAEVERFAAEISPTIWVLDMKRLNLSSATNVIAQIMRIGDQSR